MASKLILSEIHGAGGQPVAFPNGIYIGSGAPGALNNIGIPGQPGFGNGICPSALPAGLSEMYGTRDQFSDTYGLYQFSEGSIMRWRPAFYHKWGTGANGLAVNAIDIKPFDYFNSVTSANASGYALHRAFYDGGVVQPGYFEDVFKCSNNGGIASSLRNGVALACAQRGGITTTAFATLNGAPANAQLGALAAAKTRGPNFIPVTNFMVNVRTIISIAHAAASTSTTYCAWYDPTGVASFPKGCNNNALGDANDAAIAYVDDGTGTNCGLTGSANFYARTTDNGQNCGIADVNGLLWEIAFGISSDGTNFYVLNQAVAIKNLTAGNTLATDAWGAPGLAALYTSLGATYGALTASSTQKSIGNAAQVFSEATSGLAWEASCAGIPLLGGVGGTNQFGNDGLWDYRPVDMSPFVSGGWLGASSAGVSALDLDNVRTTSAATVGLRSALYLG